MVALYLLVALLLLLLNAFFVLAEFAAVKLRPTRVETLARSGDRRAVLMRHIQSHLDEYLSVCQVGITLASIGLGFVGERAFARLLEPLFRWTGAASEAVAHGIAISVAYVLVSFLHIVLGELVPKSMAIRGTEGAALFSARPLRAFHFIFYVPLVILNGSANLVLRLLGYPPRAHEKEHSQEELKIILAGSQSKGLISFRRLLLIENVFDLADLKVGDAMRRKHHVKTLRIGTSWDDVSKIMRETRFSRYPVVDAADRAVGILHVKDALYDILAGRPPADLAALARPAMSVPADLPLERLLTELQRQRTQASVVTDSAGNWSGFITMEDVLEEIVGTIEDEFETEPPLFVADAMTVGRVVLNVSAASLREAIAAAMARVDPGELPGPPEEITRFVQEREAAMSTYLGRGVAIPHARLEKLARSTLILARSELGVPVDVPGERANLLFILLTPSGMPREQVRLVARIARLLESEYVTERLMQAGTPQEILEAVREGDSAR